jgi:hypothetical protein
MTYYLHLECFSRQSPTFWDGKVWPGSGSAWIRIGLVPWIRIRIEAKSWIRIRIGFSQKLAERFLKQIWQQGGLNDVTVLGG